MEIFPGQESWAISVVAVAALLGNFPVVHLVNKVGIRTVFAGLGVLSAVSTLLIPTAIRVSHFALVERILGFYWFLAARFLQGFAFAANFPVIGSFCAKWTYFKQNGLFVSALVAYVQLAPALTMPASGALCHAFRWPSIFYAHGAVSLFLFITYGLFYRNSPGKHPFVGNVELRKISVGKIGNLDWPTPFFHKFFSILPNHPTTPHHKSRSATVTSIKQSSYLLLTVLGMLSDRIKFISEKNKFRLFNSVAFLGSAIFLTVLAFMGDSHKNWNMIVLGCAAGILGATTGGFFKAGPVISKQYSHFVTGNISLGITITMLVVPFLVHSLTPHNIQDEWKWVFLVVAAVMVITNMIFLVFIRGEPCEWTKDEFVRSHTMASVKVHDGTNEPPATEQRF
ncbi:transporter, major facilitator family protein [Ancylostoma ceylanicum]|uniref:Transporter, major facilitator family protein n=1 Tax=Ancylostoma ceylanicum TaxID=53326 RepID=A0A0D6M0C0_9BILA|nr:transporter, major facilitator family protein [Ancylostoma ceylanicum]